MVWEWWLGKYKKYRVWHVLCPPPGGGGRLTLELGRGCADFQIGSMTIPLLFLIFGEDGRLGGDPSIILKLLKYCWNSYKFKCLILPATCQNTINLIYPSSCQWPWKVTQRLQNNIFRVGMKSLFFYSNWQHAFL